MKFRHPSMTSRNSNLMRALAASVEGRQWLTKHFRVQGPAVLKENSDDLHLIAEKPKASASGGVLEPRGAIARIGCHLQRSATICSAQLQTPKNYIFWQNTGINMTFKQVCSLILNRHSRWISSARVRFMHCLNTSKYHLFGTQTELCEQQIELMFVCAAVFHKIQCTVVFVYILI